MGTCRGVVFAATLFHGLIVLPAIAWLVSGMNPLQFLRAVSQPMITALFTSSSAATLPLSMNTAQTKLGVDSARSAFVLPLGATSQSVIGLFWEAYLLFISMQELVDMQLLVE